MTRPPLPRNVRAFLAFRVLFNARFYYPVLAVLFVDLGLTLDRYAMLNVAWAASIVCFELPLGALADRIGRRPLVVGAGALMVVEMAVLSFAPTGNPELLFWVFLVNRVLSGLAEAAASGADEAMAYDTLIEEGRSAEWPRVLSHMQRLMSVGFLISMVVGAAVYDSEAVNGLGRLLGQDWELAQATTARFPVYLTLLLSVGALLAAMRMREVGERDPEQRGGIAAGVREVLDSGRWIRASAFVTLLILFTLSIDSMSRLFLTLGSSYYRLIGIPAALFGLIGAMFACLGMLSPPIATRLIGKWPPLINFAILTVITLTGFVGIVLVKSWHAVVCVAMLGLSFQLLNFLVSHYLNAVTESKRRATVLSFKSLAGNLAYGAAGWGYALLMRSLAGGERPEPGSPLEAQLLESTFVWFPVALAIFVIPLFLWGFRSRRMKSCDLG